MPTAIERFMAFVLPEPNSGCWLWTGSMSTRVYGYFKLEKGKRGLAAHRASWTLHFGEIPKNTMVLHRCDTPLCVNPQHLFLGNAVTNARDMVAKGRNPDQTGENAYWHRLTWKQVGEIRSSQEPQSVLARRYNIHQTQISRIKQNKRWRVSSEQQSTS